MTFSFIGACAAAVLISSSALANTLTLERLTPRLSGERIIEIRSSNSGSDDGYFLSSKDGKILRRNPTDGTITTVLAPVADPDGFDLAYSMTFAPDFETSGLIYVSYGSQADTHVIAEYALSDDGSQTFDPASRRVVLTIQHDRPNNHYGADVEFGPDGYLYVTTGDGDQEITDNPIVSQDVTDRRGKILRIDPTGDAFPDDALNNYGIPNDNPDFGDDADPALYAIGLRNPFRATFDTVTNRYFIADVGEDAFEEINLGQAGANYGWNAFEGSDPLLGSDALSTFGLLTDPLLAYGREGSQSITGGLVYRGGLAALSDLEGQFIYADFRTDEIFSIDAAASDDSTPTVTSYDLDVDFGSANRLVAFGTDGAGNLFASSFFGDVYQITGATIVAPVPVPASAWFFLTTLIGLSAVKRGGKAIPRG